MKPAKRTWLVVVLLLSLPPAIAAPAASLVPGSMPEGYFEGPWEVEPNNSYLRANGPLRSGKDYYGHPNDAKDYYSILVDSAGQITVDLMNHSGQGVQLQLFYQSVANRVAGDRDAPYQVEHVGQPGWYYIYVFTESGFNTLTPYTLRTTYPMTGPGPTEGRVYLPLILGRYPPPALANGGFESGDASGWQVSGDNVLPAPRVVTTDPHTGDHALLLGGADYCDTPNSKQTGHHSSVAKQTIRVPGGAGIPTLTFWYRIDTYDHVTWANGRTLGDSLDVYVGDELALRDNYENYPSPAPGCKARQDSTWRSPGTPWFAEHEYPLSFGRVHGEVLNLTKWKGQAVELRFELWTRHDGILNTWAYLDDVSITITPTPVWETEPNDDPFKQANGPLVSGVTYYGTFPTTEDEQDSFFFDLTTARSVEVWLTRIASGQDDDLLVHDPDVAWFAVSVNGGNADEHVAPVTLAPGRYYILVFNLSEEGTTQPYRLRVVYE